MHMLALTTKGLFEIYTIDLTKPITRHYAEHL